MNLILFIRYLFFFLGLISSATIFAQTGSISGQVTETFAGEIEPVIGAIVNVEGSSKATTTDLEGNFVLDKIEAGKYNIKITYLGYVPKVLKEIVVEEGKAKSLGAIKIEEDVKTTEEIVVYGTRNTSSEVSVMNEIKKLDVVASGISNEQIKRTLDRDASDVAKRVSGVTVVDNRFVIVRGLSERYNAVMLNNALAPSFEQDVKSFSLDNLPSQFIDRMIIYKSPSPDLPGDFAGGVVKIYTQGMPAKNNFSVGFSSSYRQGTTGQEFLSTPSGKNAWLGYDDGKYSYPKGVPPDYLGVNSEKYDAIKVGKLFHNDTWNPSKSKASPDIRFNINGGYRLKLGRDRILGITSGVNYSKTSQINYDGNQSLFFSSFGGQEASVASVNAFDNHIKTVRLGIIQNFTMQLDSKNTVELKNMYSHVGVNRYRNAYFYSINNPEYYYSRPELITYNTSLNLSNSYGGLLSSQFLGKHTIFNNTDVNWLVGYSRADRDEPDMKNYILQYTPYSKREISYNYLIGDKPNPVNFGRLYYRTFEESRVTSADISKRFITDILGGQTELSVKGGWYLDEKNRIFDVRGYGYGGHILQPGLSGKFYNDADITKFSPEDLNKESTWNNYNGLVLLPSGQEGAYTAKTDLNAFYGMTKLSWKEKITISGGMRLENYTQTVSGYKVFNQNWLPSINASYNITKKFLLRGSYGKTINRPDLRETSPAITYDYFLRQLVIGNAKLKAANINNYDIKFEFYPNPDEVISIGFFYKEFKNPIERIFVNSNPTSSVTQFDVNFLNASRAYSKGIEVEGKKSLKKILFIKGKDIFRDLSVNLNASFLQSRIVYNFEELKNSGITNFEIGGDNNIALFKQLNGKNRPLLAQSPYLINAGLTYNNEKSKTMVNVAYNIMGRRLTALIPGVGSIYEIPRHVIDITLVQNIGKYIELKVGVQDLINQKIQFVEDLNNDGKVKRIKGTGYVTDPSSPKYPNNGAFFNLGNQPQGASEDITKMTNYNQGDVEYLGFKRGRYYSIGITLKF